MAAAEKSNLMEKLVSLCKRRGFVFPGSEIYGGLNGTWDLGPLGVLLASNIKTLWWNAMVRGHDEIVGLDSTILHHPKVWEASGHVKNFTDPLIECKNCHTRFRSIIQVSPHAREQGFKVGEGDVCPNCGSKDLTEEK